MQLINPVEYAIIGNFKASYVETTIHGELHAHTVLIDKCNDTWLIDFVNTGKGPLLQDYIAFEASLLVENNEIPAGQAALSSGRGRCSPSPASYFRACRPNSPKTPTWRRCIMRC